MRLFRVSRLVTIALVLALALPLALTACGSETKTEEEVLPPAGFVVEPPIATIGAKVSILGSELPVGAEVEVRIRMQSETSAVGVTASLTPTPEVNEFGAFASELTLTGYVAGVYTVQLVVDEEVVATVPLQVKAAQ